jgi:rare lipoprotein A
MRPTPKITGLLLVLTLAGCAGPVVRSPSRLTPDTAAGSTPAAPAAPAPRSPAKRGGGYYLDDGPGDQPPDDARLAAIPDAKPRAEPPHRFANRPYTVFNRNYVPLDATAPYKASGIGSWYGRKFHGQRTSNGETYDMYAMTAAHTTLPLPSYARVTNPANGRSVVVRVNDRGPFHADRIIDLSYAAAWKLGYIGSGSTRLEVERILPGDSTASPSTASDPLGDLLQRTEQRQPAQRDDALLPEYSEAHGIWLQLGAFGNPDNAENLKAHLSREIASLTDEHGAPLGGQLVVQARAGLYRLQFGPWPNRAAAQQAAERLRTTFDIQPVVARP